MLVAIPSILGFGLGLLNLTAASPVPQGVTAAIAPPGIVPSGCVTNEMKIFGIWVEPTQGVEIHDVRRRQVTQISDGQPQAPTGHPAPHPPSTHPGAPSHIQGSCHPSSTGCSPISHSGCGQLSCAPAPPTPYTSAQGCSRSGQICRTPTYGVSQISDGQIQAPTGYPVPPQVTQINDGQIQAPPVYPTGWEGSNYECGEGESCYGGSVWESETVTQINDGQIQAPPHPPYNGCVAGQACPLSPASSSSPHPPVTQISDGQIQATRKPMRRDVAPRPELRQQANLLTLALHNGTLTDSNGRTGYIASNRQLQFDQPPQAGAIYTTGFAVCAGDKLALGSSMVFYQCLSGAFYNLYDRRIAAQCPEKTILCFEFLFIKIGLMAVRIFNLAKAAKMQLY